MKLPFVDQIREMLHAAPFVPFIVRLHSGRALKVSNPDFLSVTFSGRVIWDDGQGYRHLNPVLIASVDEGRNGRRKS